MSAFAPALTSLAPRLSTLRVGSAWLIVIFGLAACLLTAWVLVEGSLPGLAPQEPPRWLVWVLFGIGAVVVVLGVGRLARMDW